MNLVRQYTILISVPSDVQNEVTIVRNVLDSFNATIGKINGINLLPVYWSTDAYPQAGNTPQNIINNQIVEQSDAVIATFWTRFGSPTDKYQSGTEEEIEYMIENGKQIFLYFSDVPASPNSINFEQYEQVKAFREKYKNRGLYFTYDSLEKFEKLLFNHLIFHFIQNELQEGSLNTTKRTNSKLEIRSYVDDAFTNTLSYIRTKFTESKLIHDNLEEINTLIDEIDQIKLVKRTDVTPQHNNEDNMLLRGLLKDYKLNVDKFASIPMDTQNEIRIFAKKHFNKIINDDFFCLGDLKYVRDFSLLGAQEKISGTEIEEKKYRITYELLVKIRFHQSIYNYFSILDSYSKLWMVLSNVGKSYDEDITITLYVPKGNLIKENDIPIPEYPALKFINENFDFFFISQTNQELESYPDYPPSYNVPLISSLLGKSYTEKVKEKEDKFNSKIAQTFVYDYFTSDQFDIIKYEQQYLKHNTNTNMPSFLIFKEQVKLIRYEITSKHNPDKVAGEITIDV